MKPSKKSPQHRDFADRLCIAYDRVTDAPAKNYGHGS